MVKTLEIHPLIKAVTSLDSVVQFIVSGQLLQITQTIGDVQLLAVSKAVSDMSYAKNKDASMRQVVAQLHVAHTAFEMGWKKLDTNLGGIDWATFDYNHKRDIQSLMLLTIFYIALNETHLARKTLETIQETASKSSIDGDGFSGFVRIVSHLLLSGFNWRTYILPERYKNDRVLSMSTNELKEYASTFVERASMLISDAELVTD